MVELKQTIRGGDVLERRADGVVDRIHDDGSISREQDVTGILDLNRERRAEDKFRGFRFADPIHLVASIPVAAVDIAMAQGMDILNDQEAMKKFLNDPQNAAFRTTTERV